MGESKDSKRPELSDADISEIVELGWRDEVTFDDIKTQTGLLEKEVIQIMRSHMKPSSFRMWRKRVSGRSTKHAAQFEKSQGRNEGRNEGRESQGTHQSKDLPKNLDENLDKD